MAVAIPLVQLIDRRNRRGHGDGRLRSRQRLWRSKLITKLAAISSSRAANKNWPATTAAGLRRLILAVDGDAIEFHAMVNETVAEAFCNDFLQCFQLGVDEFNDFAGFYVDEVIMMRLW